MQKGINQWSRKFLQIRRTSRNSGVEPAYCELLIKDSTGKSQKFQGKLKDLPEWYVSVAHKYGLPMGWSLSSPSIRDILDEIERRQKARLKNGRTA